MAITKLKGSSVFRKVFFILAVALFGGLIAFTVVHDRDVSAAATITILPTQPAALVYSDLPVDLALANAYAKPGALVVAGRYNFQDQVFKNVSANNGTVLIYINAMLNNAVGPYHDLLINDSVCGPAVPKWPGLTAMANQWGYLNDFRVGGIEQVKLECVLEKMVTDNPHMAGWFADDIGSRSWYPGYAPVGQPKSVTSQYNWANWSTSNKQAYRDGAVALTQTFRKVADKHGLIFIVNGTWSAGSIANSGGGYPDANQHGNSLADGGFVEHHDGEQSFFVPYACSAQWAAQSPVTHGEAIMYEISLSDSDRNIYANSGCFAYASSQADYDIAQAPWTTFHPTGLPTNALGGISTMLDIIAPSVGVSSPTDGTMVYGKSTEISATATDNVGVSGVQFQLNGTNLGNEVTNSPFSYSLDTTALADGAYVLSAVARDGSGNKTTSTGVNIIINNTTPPPDIIAPTVSISSPTNSSVVAGNNVNIVATANDNVGVAGVQFQLNNVNLGPEATSSPFSYSLDTTALADGAYVLSAVARDQAGNITTSANTSFVVDNIPDPDTIAPSVSITSPTLAASVSGNSVAVTSTASDNTAVVGVQFILDGNNLGDEDVSYPYNATWDTTIVSNGTHILTAVARDSSGNSMTSIPVTVTVNNIPPDTIAPFVSISAPANNSIVSENSVAVNAAATDNIGVAGVQFKLNGVNIGTEDTLSPYSYTWNTTTQANGTYTLTAVARDLAGNKATSSPITVTVNNTPVQTPYGGTARALASTIQAEDFDNGGEGVAYHDTTTGNSGGKYRTANNNVDIESNGAGYSVGYTATGEWLEYTVNAVAGTYTINLRIATTSTSTMVVKLDSSTLATVSIPNTGGWTTWKTVSVKNIKITTGNNKVLRVEFPSKSVDLDWISFVKQ